MNKKYKIREDLSIIYENRKLYRIEALKDLIVYCHHKIKKGRLGGWIEKEDNLSQEGNCWIDGDAKVYDNAKILDDAIIYENAEVFENAKIYGKAYVYGNAYVLGNTEVFEIGKVCGKSILLNNTKIHGSAFIKGKKIVNSDISGCCEVEDNSEVFNSQIYGRSKINNNCYIQNSVVFDSILKDSVNIIDSNINNVILNGNAKIKWDDLDDKKNVYNINIMRLNSTITITNNKVIIDGLVHSIREFSELGLGQLLDLFDLRDTKENIKYLMKLQKLIMCFTYMQNL